MLKLKIPEQLKRFTLIEWIVVGVMIVLLITWAVR